jgi:CHAD domain-containing protein
MAVLEIFSALLPPKRCKWFAKQIKRVRKAAGDARDLDVLAPRLTAVCQQDGTIARIALLERLAAARRAAQPPIAQIHRKLRKRGFRRRAKKLIAKNADFHNGGSPFTFLAAAQTGMRALAAPFFSAAEGDFESTLALHEFRIVTKQLRYTMEVFAAAFGPGFRNDLYPLVEELQEKLGAINDHANARDRYFTWLDEATVESQRLLLGKLIAMETAALKEATRRFREWWTPAQAANLKTRFWQEILPAEVQCA